MDAGTEYKNPELERRVKEIEKRFKENADVEAMARI